MTQTAELGRVRIHRDVRGERTDYERLEVGRGLGSMEFSVTQKQIDLACDRMEYHHPYYEVDSPFGGTVAPVGLTYGTTRQLFTLTYNVRGLFYKWALEFLEPVRPGVQYVVTARLADKWIKNDREFVAYESTCRDGAGNVIFTTRRAHTLDFIKRTEPKTAEGGLDSANWKLPTAPQAAAASTAAVEPSRPFGPAATVEVRPMATMATPLGAALPSFAMSLSQERFEKWYSRPITDPSAPRSLHIDPESARQEGLPAPVAVGPDIIGFAHRSAMQFFGAGWVKGGRADLTVARPTFPGDYVTSRGFVKGRELLADGSVRLLCEVWVENQSGEKKVVGTVSGLVR